MRPLKKGNDPFIHPLLNLTPHLYYITLFIPTPSCMKVLLVPLLSSPLHSSRVAAEPRSILQQLLELVLMCCSGREALAQHQVSSLSQAMSFPFWSRARWMFSPLSTQTTYKATQILSRFTKHIPSLYSFLACLNSGMANNY